MQISKRSHWPCMKSDEWLKLLREVGLRVRAFLITSFVRNPMKCPLAHSCSVHKNMLVFDRNAGYEC